MKCFVFLAFGLLGLVHGGLINYETVTEIERDYEMYERNKKDLSFKENHDYVRKQQLVNREKFNINAPVTANAIWEGANGGISNIANNAKFSGVVQGVGCNVKEMEFIGPKKTKFQFFINLDGPADQGMLQYFQSSENTQELLEPASHESSRR